MYLTATNYAVEMILKSQKSDVKVSLWLPKSSKNYWTTSGVSKFQENGRKFAWRYASLSKNPQECPRMHWKPFKTNESLSEEVAKKSKVSLSKEKKLLRSFSKYQKEPEAISENLLKHHKILIKTLK